MTREKPAGRVLGELTGVASSLADFATSHIDVVLRELSGADVTMNISSDTEAEVGKRQINLGLLAQSVMQLAGRAGDLITQLSKYDLIRNDVGRLKLHGDNPISTISVAGDKEGRYVFLVENDGAADETFEIAAWMKSIQGQDALDEELDAEPASGVVEPGERRRVTVSLPSQDPGPYRLKIELRCTSRNGLDSLVARKIVQVTVLPRPQPHGDVERLEHANGSRKREPARTGRGASPAKKSKPSAKTGRGSASRKAKKASR